MLANLIPVYLYQGQPLPPVKYHYDYVLAEQGLLKRLDTPLVTAERLLAPVGTSLPGLRLQAYPLAGVRLKVPRIPGRLLAKVYRDACRDLSLEVLYHFKHTPTRGWWVERAELTHQSAVRLTYLADPQHLALDLHSHHRMEAFFSDTDDADEQGARFYAVIGRLDTPRPELALRLGMHGHYYPNLPGLTLFDDLGPFTDKWLPPDLTTPLAPRYRWYDKLFRWR
jgi:PRTRC genetic system protein A